MKIKRSQLKRIIQEELHNVLVEQRQSVGRPRGTPTAAELRGAYNAGMTQCEEYGCTEQQYALLADTDQRAQQAEQFEMELARGQQYAAEQYAELVNPPDVATAGGDLPYEGLERVTQALTTPPAIQQPRDYTPAYGATESGELVPMSVAIQQGLGRPQGSESIPETEGPAPGYIRTGAMVRDQATGEVYFDPQGGQDLRLDFAYGGLRRVPQRLFLRDRSDDIAAQLRRGHRYDDLTGQPISSRDLSPTQRVRSAIHGTSTRAQGPTTATEITRDIFGDPSAYNRHHVGYNMFNPSEFGARDLTMRDRIDRTRRGFGGSPDPLDVAAARRAGAAAVGAGGVGAAAAMSGDEDEPREETLPESLIRELTEAVLAKLTKR